MIRSHLTQLLTLSSALLWGSTAAAAPCEAPLAKDALDAGIHEAEQAWLADPSAFAAVREGLWAQLDCLDRPVTPAEGARLQRLWGLFLVEDQRQLDAARAFALARGVDPALDFADLEAGLEADEARPAAEVWLAYPTERIAREEPVDGVIFDGLADAGRPKQQAGLVQVLQGEAAAPLSVWLDPQAALPEPAPGPVLAAAEPPVAAVAEPPSSPAPRTSHKRGRGLTIAGIATGGVAAGTYGIAFLRAEHYRAGLVPEESTESYRNGNNGLVVGSAAVGAVGLSLLVLGQIGLRW